MNSKRVFFGMVGLVVLLVLANLGAVFVGQQLLQKKSEKLTELKLDSKVLDAQQSSISQAKKDISKYSELENIAKSIVPQDKDQAEAVREIVKIAGDNKIILSTISFPASTLGQAAAAAPTGTDTTTPKPKAASTALTQVLPVTGITGVYSLQIIVQQDTTAPINYSQFIAFLTALEQNRRTSQVTGITVTPNPADRSQLTFNLTLQAYIKP
jgi:septal ring-binding cell division protein DamX